MKILVSKLKEIFLDHRGYIISGTVYVRVKGDEQPTNITMHPTFICNSKLIHGSSKKPRLTHNSIKKSINIGNLLAKNATEIMGAKVDITEVRSISPVYNKYKKTIWISGEQLKDVELIKYE